MVSDHSILTVSPMLLESKSYCTSSELNGNKKKNIEIGAYDYSEEEEMKVL